MDSGATEIDLYSETTGSRGYRSATVPGLEIDHGLLPAVQVRLNLPLAFAGPSGQPGQYGLGDGQLGLKVQLLKETADLPAITVFPLVSLPIGSTSQGLGQGRPSLITSLWGEKHFAAWKVFGGGGVLLEHGANRQPAPFLGVAFTRPVWGRLSLGAEVFHREPAVLGRLPSTSVSMGGSYDVSDTYHLYFSVGRAVQNPVTNLGSAYVAVAFTF